jgi:uncharacterized metal-binding protein (TIGR02443 family)
MASSETGRRRFIAGAVCPGCGAEDKIFVVVEVDGTYRACSQCEFKEKLEDLPEGTEESEVQVVKLPQ